MEVEYLLGDHLGSTSITTDPTGAKVSELHYKPWGEIRYNADVTPTEYQFTGQFSYESQFGLLFFNTRWLDPAIGRFAQADTIIPEQTQGTQAWDRYAFVNNNPVRYTDPSGHKCVGDIDECSALQGDKKPVFLKSIPTSLKSSHYENAFNRGIGFVNQLLSHKGWWTPYLNSNDSETTWKFLLTLAYVFESYSYSQMPNWSTFKQYMTDSIVNKVGDLYNDYGTAGFYIYIGGREALFEARGQYDDSDPRWVEGTPEYMDTWDLSYLGIDDTYGEAVIEVDKSWELITAYIGVSLYGTNAYDYGVAPPLTIDKTKLVWKSSTIRGYNPWTEKFGPYWLYFHSK